MKKRTIFLTTALPYANGKFHMGHMLEYIQADIWVRNQRMEGNTVHFVGADDAHGAPIMVSAQKLGITPQEFIKPIAEGRKEYLDGFHIKFDHWHSTNSEENVKLSQEIYFKLKEAGLIYTKVVEQFYDPVKNMFLADRFIKGTCPRCHAEDQYGDSCEKCGAVYSPTELINPFSALSGAKPEIRSSEHYFFKLSDPRCVEFLREWTKGIAPDGTPHIQPQIQAKTEEWLGKDGELSDWDISRDGPYFGIPIPDAPGKFFYVWLDAPIGYLASLLSYCQKRGINFEGLLLSSETEQIHFIGKDIAYFHTLFWPAMLHFAGKPFKTPNHVWCHGFLTVDGAKMSKSRGTGLDPLAYLKIGMDPEWLRYYLGYKFNAKVEDIDFSAKDFIQKVNTDLVGKYVNIASRSAGFILKRFGGKVDAQSIQNCSLIKKLKEISEEIRNFYDTREFNRALRKIMASADKVNEYVDDQKPWVLAKEEGKEAELQKVCSITLEAFRLLTLYLKPVLPVTAAKAEEFLGCGNLDWSTVDNSLNEATVIKPYQHLMSRATEDQLKQLFEMSNPANKAAQSSEAAKKQEGQSDTSSSQATHVDKNIETKSTIGENVETEELVYEPLQPNINIDDFNKIDLRIAKIVDCKKVKKSNKLLQLTVDAGEGRTRNIFSGIAAYYNPEDLIGKLTVIVANLEPRKMMGEFSEGMLLSASDGGGHTTGLYLLEPNQGAIPGMRIH
ncbi:MAG: methionine--tRNA ligase [Burkholderiales bacterium]|nr:methionine--tRNA ligase [Burkholderiales bacterium]